MAQAIRLRVRSHDNYQLEFKIDYRLLRDKETRYTIDLYLFIPQSLDINERTYAPTDYYRDAKNYVRLRTPRLRLDTLASAPTSPLVHCEYLVNTPNWQHNETFRSHLASSLKLMRPVLNASLGGHVRRIAALADAPTAGPNRTAHIETLVTQLLDSTGEINQRFRALHPHVLRAGRESEVAAIYRLADEAISLVIENALVRAYRALNEYPDRGAAACLQERIAEENQREIVYRREQRYGVVLNHANHMDDASTDDTNTDGTGGDKENQDAGENTDYLYRASLLKKVTLSPLFLSTAVRREGTTTEQFLYAFAAGLSMIFATIVAFFAQARFGMLTFPVFVSLVVAYMFKDRIKEIGRALFAGYMRRFFYDQRTVLYTPDEEHRLGYIREKVDFIGHEETPPGVLARRHDHLPVGVRSTDLQEEILHYSKQVLINRDAFRHMDVDWLNITGVRDIMRYDVRPYLRKMANPNRLKYYLDGEEMQAAHCHKTYSLYAVIEYGPRDDKQRAHRQLTRVRLDRNGIVDISSGREWRVGSGE